jgi:biotin carboxyl carrier protein
MKLQLAIDGQIRQVDIEPSSNGHWRLRLDGELVVADVCPLRPGVLSLLIAGQSYRVVLDGHPSDPALHVGPERIAYRIEDPRSLRQRRRAAGGDGPVTLKASMPGRVVRILIEEGEPVAAHQAVVVIEAMKMQNELKSPRDGRVTHIRVSPGDTVASGDTLAVIE